MEEEVFNTTVYNIYPLDSRWMLWMRGDRTGLRRVSKDWDVRIFLGYAFIVFGAPDFWSPVCRFYARKFSPYHRV